MRIYKPYSKPAGRKTQYFIDRPVSFLYFTEEKGNTNSNIAQYDE